MPWVESATSKSRWAMACSSLAVAVPSAGMPLHLLSMPEWPQMLRVQMVGWRAMMPVNSPHHAPTQARHRMLDFRMQVTTVMLGLDRTMQGPRQTQATKAMVAGRED